MRKMLACGGFQGDLILPYNLENYTDLEKNDYSWEQFHARFKAYDVDSVSSLFEKIDVIKKDNPDRETWFRGQSKAEYNLVPSLFRGEGRAVHPSDKKDVPTQVYFGDFNYKKLSRVSQAAAHSLGMTGLSGIESLGVAQHYGISTPLLDWSYNPLIALWFAVDGRKNDSQKIPKQRQPAIIWILDPGYANDNQGWWYKNSSSGITSRGVADKPLLIGPTWVDDWLEERLISFGQSHNEEELALYADAPLAIYSKSDFSARILRQSGAFTIGSFPSRPRGRYHPEEMPPYDADRDDGNTWAVTALTIEPSSFEKISQELKGYNIYPDTVWGDRSFDKSILKIFSDYDLPSGEAMRRIK